MPKYGVRKSSGGSKGPRGSKGFIPSVPSPLSKQKGGKAELAEQVYKPVGERQTIDGWTPANGNERSQIYTKGDKAIVSIRGTDVRTSPRDLGNDVLLATGLLKYSPRYTKDKKTVESAIKKYGKDNVEVVGHSLGGKIAKEISRDTGVKAKTYNKGASISDFVQGGVDRVACKVNPKGKRCKKAGLSTHYRTKSDPVSLLGAIDKNTKLVKNKSGIIGTHNVGNFRGRGRTTTAKAERLESFESPPARFRRVDTYMDSVPPVLQIHPLSAHEKAKLALERSRLETAEWNPITPEIKIRRLELELKKRRKRT